MEAELWGADGRIFSFGSGLGPRGVKETLTLPATGTYTLFLRGAGGSTGAYSLKLKGKGLKVKAADTATFANDQDLKIFQFDALAGSNATFKAKAKGKNLDGTRLQPVIYLFDGEGKLLATSGLSGKPSAAVDLTVPETGTYYRAVGPAEGTHGTAKLTGALKFPKSKRVLRETFE